VVVVCLGWVFVCGFFFLVFFGGFFGVLFVSVFFFFVSSGCGSGGLGCFFFDCPGAFSSLLLFSLDIVDLAVSPPPHVAGPSPPPH